jgi:arginase
LAEIIAALNDDTSALPVVIGGDCSILLGALAGRRRQGALSLVHIDGHSDFRHPGNYNAAEVSGRCRRHGSCAGNRTGRGTAGGMAHDGCSLGC